jgi:hypothetical protein
MSTFAATIVPTQFVDANGIRFAHRLVRKLKLVRTASRTLDRGNRQGHDTPEERTAHLTNITQPTLVVSGATTTSLSTL